MATVTATDLQLVETCCQLKLVRKLWSQIGASCCCLYAQGLGANPTALKWYQQSELVHARWAMLGVAGILVQELVKPSVFWYEAGLPQNLPEPFKDINMGGLLAWEFILMHWVEVRRWQDYKNFGSVNEVRRRQHSYAKDFLCSPLTARAQLQWCSHDCWCRKHVADHMPCMLGILQDPIFKGNKVPNTQMVRTGAGQGRAGQGALLEGLQCIGQPCSDMVRAGP